VSEIGLQSPGIDALVGQCIAAGVAQHVSMNREGQFGFNASPLDQFSQASDRERRTALRNKDKGRLGFALQSPQRSQLIAQQWVSGRCPAFGSTEVQAAGLEFNVA
jgi:hypothetical protein